ncbi:hypothetical protein CBOM_07007 [Ceraceosorus bombacis]|uniref:Uncharacterized protein n=1 Tax=Ceraceosorus bombacis TaxID=401625 RepID=A0A0P1BKC8_9BASI|nr:hypothetical protein CBOM_07007 [Ceraceosorus bombacis]
MLESRDSDWYKAAWNVWNDLPVGQRILPAPLFTRLFWACSRTHPGGRPRLSSDRPQSIASGRSDHVREEAADLREALAHLKRLDALARYGKEAHRRLHITELHALLHAHLLPRQLLRATLNEIERHEVYKLDSPRIIDLLAQHPHFVLEWKLHREVLMGLIWSHGWDDDIAKLVRRLTLRGWSDGKRSFHRALMDVIMQSPAVRDKLSAQEEAISIAMRMGPVALPPSDIVAGVFQQWSTPELLAFRNLEASRTSRSCAFNPAHHEALRPHAVLELLVREDAVSDVSRRAERMLQQRLSSIPLGLPQELDYSAYSQEVNRDARISLGDSASESGHAKDTTSLARPPSSGKFWRADFSSLGSDSDVALQSFVGWDPHVKLGYAISRTHALRALAACKSARDARPALLEAVELFTRLPRSSSVHAARALDALLGAFDALISSAEQVPSVVLCEVRRVDNITRGAIAEVAHKLVAVDSQLRYLPLEQHLRLLQHLVVCAHASLASTFWSPLNAKTLDGRRDSLTARSASSALPESYVRDLLAMALWRLPSPKGGYELVPRWNEAAPHIELALEVFRVHGAKLALPTILIVRLVRELLTSHKTGAQAMEVLEHLSDLDIPLNPGLARGIVQAFAEAGDMWADQALSIAEAFWKALLEKQSHRDPALALSMLAYAIDAGGRSFVGWSPTRRKRVLGLFTIFRQQLDISIKSSNRQGSLAPENLRLDAFPQLLDFKFFHVDKSGRIESLIEQRMKEGTLQSYPISRSIVRLAYNGAARAVLAEPAYELGLAGVQLEPLPDDFLSPPLTPEKPSRGASHKIPDSVDPTLSKIFSELEDDLGVQLDSRAWGLLIVAWLLPYQKPKQAGHARLRPPSWPEMGLEEAAVFDFVRDDFLNEAMTLFDAAKDARYERGGMLSLPLNATTTPSAEAAPVLLKSGHVGRLIVALARAERFEDAWRVYDDFYAHYAPPAWKGKRRGTQRSGSTYGWTYGVDGARAYLLARSGQKISSISGLMRLPSHRIGARWRQEVLAAQALAERKGIRFVRKQKAES